jgi:hypothetical protein
MDRAEKCFFCERTSPEADLVAWFVQDERRTTHGACWLEAYRSQRLPVSSSADPGQPSEVLRPDQAPRKTLDDIRRELEAEYPDESDAAETVPVALDEEASVVERHRSASRRSRRRRRHATAVLGGIAGSVLLVLSYVAVTRGTIPLAAIASAPDVPGSNAAGTDAEADRTSPNTSAARPTADEHRGIEPRDAQPAAVLPLALLTELDQQVKALRSDLQALAARLEGSDSRIAGMESRVKGVESSMRRLADDVASAAAIRAAGRPVTAPRQTAGRPVPVAPAPPAPAAVTVADSRRWIPAEHSAPEGSSTSDVRPVAEAVASPEPRTASPTQPGVAPTRGGSAVSDNASRSSVPPTLGEKLRADWRTIKQGFASAGDELKASMRDFTRKTTRE